jgi:dienelactone hydrolase
MKMKVSIALLLTVFYFVTGISFAQTKVEFPSEDDLTVTAELYSNNKSKAVIVLFHQAGSSRGEYRDIAPRLTMLGYTALAVDQRSGGNFRGVKNETAARAKSGRDFPSALPDMRAAINYAKSELGAEEVVIWGSSYSASLSLVLAGRKEVPIDGVMAFSPGEYFGGSISVKKEARGIEVPVFLTSARNEVRSWNSIYKAIPASKNSIAYKPKGKGKHGSSTLLSSDADEYWVAIESFLSQHFAVE